MNTVSVTQARKTLYSLVDTVSDSHKPLVITGRRNNAVLISEEDWASVQATLYLTSIPGMRESLLEGAKTPLSKCRKALEW